MLVLSPQLTAVVAFSAGLVLGSFLNVVIARYGSGLGIFWSRSRCMQCGKILRWWELIPLLSFLLLSGKCARCRQAISWQYPIVELSMGLIAAILLTSYQARGDLAIGILLTLIAACLLVLGGIDWQTFLLPNRYILVLTIFVMAVLLIRGEQFKGDTGWGIAIGVGFLGLLWLMTRGQGIGLGDVKLMIPLGALFGSMGTVTLLFMAFCCGGGLGLILLFGQRASLKTPIPFGPFLTGAALLLLLKPEVPRYFFSLLGG